ncbi:MULTISPECIES: LysR family transcriptional regulator [Pseudorhizobium]|uniref:HTH-type transcriptional regulator TtuA n=1 Tax=Pseudorhizobium pelagicum TaxID=1509405 RepID=A0A922TA44_9HYPH|nr:MULTISPECIES: LysR family transcriptional regulator [Pseudorhizobium]KEQ08850.1 LysR family transcriptional regulator [Pseudorhizobium pelagicum]KEQ09839.1 LysR family transcriptional regulator [Pseudorhizobium pelagicum]MDY6961677.1 LysR substrate-binding domain-containing protein [Pseudomonadota bacterium]|tara:strand:- start:302 stop:1198 length:897 start_codon:yes stop_codon:yes gene_type:complete
MSDRWQEMAVFIRVAEGGSLSRAARELEVSQPSISRILGNLEARLGTTLLLRTTRSISLTEAGSLYLERAKYLLAEMEEAEQATRGVDSLHGVIRLAMPVLYGVREVIPALATFLARHPDLRVEMIMSDARQNLVTDGVDVAIRLGVGPLEDSTFGARRLALVERLVVAAPSYLATHGAPANPSELTRHHCIVQHGLFGRESWRFTHDQTVTSVDVPAKLWINSAPGILAAAVAGLGIALATRIMVKEELRMGQLTQLLDGYRLDPAEVYAIFPAGPRPSAKVRAIVEHLAASLGARA